MGKCLSRTNETCEYNTLKNHQCLGIITDCVDITELTQTLNMYNKAREITESNINDIINILNGYNHVVLMHQSQTDFEYIYKLFDKKCKAKRCDFLIKHYSFSKQNYSNTNNIDTVSLCVTELFLRMHCYFMHQYDVGSRLTDNEWNHIPDTEQDSNDDDQINVDLTLISIHNILKDKLSKLQQITNSQRYGKYNKFSSNLSQSKVNKYTPTDDGDNDSKEEKDSMMTYSYSFRFNYLDKCKDSAESSFLDVKYRDLYIPFKYVNLKEEITSNKLSNLIMPQWRIQWQKAGYFSQTDNAKRSVADTYKYIQNERGCMNHPYHSALDSNFQDGDEISQSHLLVIIVYCSLDEFQSKFSETYRQIKKNESFTSIKKRHSNFHHFAKHLKEAVEVFGTQYMKGNIRRIYHGIDKEMLFEATQPFVFGVLSTTYEWNVAVQFSAMSGLVLELVPHGNLKYFDCQWLSRFPAEAELLFVGAFRPINFLNITNAATGSDFRLYVQPLRIIDNMTNGTYFFDDPTRIHKIANKNDDIPELNGLTEVMKGRCLALIHHELHRYDPNKYAKYNGLHQYVEDLLHQICSNKLCIFINWKTMEVDVLDEYDDSETIVDSGGHIGYDFLRLLFCNQQYEAIKLDVFATLFPQLTHIKVSNLPYISSRFLNDILQFIDHSRTFLNGLYTNITNEKDAEILKSYLFLEEYDTDALEEDIDKYCQDKTSNVEKQINKNLVEQIHKYIKITRYSRYESPRHTTSKDMVRYFELSISNESTSNESTSNESISNESISNESISIESNFNMESLFSVYKPQFEDIGFDMLFEADRKCGQQTLILRERTLR